MRRTTGCPMTVASSHTNGGSARWAPPHSRMPASRFVGMRCCRSVGKRGRSFAARTAMPNGPSRRLRPGSCLPVLLSARRPRSPRAGGKAPRSAGKARLPETVTGHNFRRPPAPTCVFRASSEPEPVLEHHFRGAPASPGRSVAPARVRECATLPGRSLGRSPAHDHTVRCCHPHVAPPCCPQCGPWILLCRVKGWLVGDVGEVVGDGVGRVAVQRMSRAVIASGGLGIGMTCEVLHVA